MRLRHLGRKGARARRARSTGERRSREHHRGSLERCWRAEWCKRCCRQQVLVSGVLCVSRNRHGMKTAVHSSRQKLRRCPRALSEDVAFQDVRRRERWPTRRCSTGSSGDRRGVCGSALAWVKCGTFFALKQFWHNLWPRARASGAAPVPSVAACERYQCRKRAPSPPELTV